MKIYLATSWRNPQHTEVLERLEREGYEVFNFKVAGLQKEKVPHWEDLGPELFRLQYARNPEVRRAFDADMAGLSGADAVVALLPAGFSTAMEIAFGVGSGKPTLVLCGPGTKPELMLYMVAELHTRLDELLHRLGHFRLLGTRERDRAQVEWENKHLRAQVTELQRRNTEYLEEVRVAKKGVLP